MVCPERFSRSWQEGHGSVLGFHKHTGAQTENTLLWAPRITERLLRPGSAALRGSCRLWYPFTEGETEESQDMPGLAWVSARPLTCRDPTVASCQLLTAPDL